MAAIPIRNIYYLLCYAWDRLDEAALTDVSMAGEPRLADLLGRVLRSGVTHLLKRGIDRRYVAENAEIAGIRGRLDISSSLKRASFPRARAWCVFDELSPDTPANRIVKTTLRNLASVSALDAELAENLRDLYRRFPGVAEVAIDGQMFRRITLGSNAAYYGFLLDVCELVHRNLLADEDTGETTFRDFTRDDAQMARLFERFLFRFFEHEQERYSVDAPHLRWHAQGKEADIGYLPLMRTDIVLRDEARTIVIDAKYYAQTLGEHFGKQTVRSDHLYQLFTYLQHFSLNRSADVAGVLIYPRTTRSVAVDAVLFGHPFRAATVDLAQAWEGIHEDLLRAIDI